MITSYTYDRLNQLRSTTEASSNSAQARSTWNEYDSVGNLTALSANGEGDYVKEIRYSYDSRNQKVGVTMADGTVEKIHYDPNGNIDATRNGMNLETTYTYDGLNRLRRSTAWLNATEKDATTIDYAQSTTGLTKTTVKTPTRTSPGPADVAVTTVESYDLAGRLLTSNGSASGVTTTSTYDDAGQTGRRLTLSVGGLQTWTYDYNSPAGGSDGRLYRVLQSLGAPVAARYEYNPDDTVSVRESPSASIRTLYSYDVCGRLNALSHQALVGGTWIARQGIIHYLDLGGRTYAYRDIVPGAQSVYVRYDYDDLDRLVSERGSDNDTEAFLYRNGYVYSKTDNRQNLYRYDYDGNVIANIAYSVTTNDRFVSSTDGYAVPSYDANGRPTSLSYPGAGTAALKYDGGDRLVGVGAHGTASAVGFVYDADGNRVRQTGAAGATNFVFDGSSVRAERSPSGIWTFRLPGVGYVENGAQFYERENAQGSTVSTANATGALVSRTFYDAYGVENAMQTGPRSRYGYAGAHGYAADGARGMLLAGARFYLPALGRFLTPDPIGHSGGFNLYAYCDNNPVAKIDPQGTIPNAGSLINTMLNSWYSTTPFSKTYYTRESALQAANEWSWTYGYDKFEIGGFMTATLPEEGGMSIV